MGEDERMIEVSRADDKCCERVTDQSKKAVDVDTMVAEKERSRRPGLT